MFRSYVLLAFSICFLVSVSSVKAVTVENNVVRFQQGGGLPVELGSVFTVDLIGEGFQLLPDGAAFSLSWDPNVLRYVDATAANPPWDASFISDAEASAGSLDYVFLSDTDDDVGAGFDLASFTFESLTEASSSLVEISDDSYGVGFVSPGANPISVAYQGLSIDVFAPAPAPAPVPVPAAIWLFASGLFVLRFKGLIRLPRRDFH